MKYLRRRKLQGLAVRRITVVLQTRKYESLQRMKGTLNNSEAVEQLIDGAIARLERRLIKTGALKKPIQKQKLPLNNGNGNGRPR